jgi:hypothetical protein
MTARPETDELIGVIHIGAAIVILAFEPNRIDEQFGWGRLACER